MFTIKETPFYKKYYLFGKCIHKRQKPIKQIADYILSISQQRYSSLCADFASFSNQINKVFEITKSVNVADNKLIIDGLYSLENWGGWMTKYTSIYLNFSRLVKEDINLEIVVSKFGVSKEQELIVFVNGEYSTVFSTSKSNDKILIKIPYSIVNRYNHRIVISLMATNQKSPLELGISKDERKISYGLIAVNSDADIILSSFDSKSFYKLRTSFLQNEWESYINTNLDDEKTTELYKNLSDESINVVNTLLYRRQNEYVFSTKELYQKYLAYTNDISKYKIVNKLGFQPEVFYFKNGLRFLDDKIIKKHLSKGCVIDGGACSGDSALMFAEYDFVKKIYAFEPLTDIYNGMAETLKVNKCSKAEAVHFGLSDKDGESEIMGEKCKTVTIDNFAKDKTISCIKLDIEGMEYNVIKGALETIKRDKPLLLICMYHTPKDFFEIKPLIESLKLGYKFKVVDTEPCNQYVGVHAMLIGYME